MKRLRSTIARSLLRWALRWDRSVIPRPRVNPHGPWVSPVPHVPIQNGR